MKNLNLTGLYLALIAKCDVTGFEVSSIIPQGNTPKEPIDVMIDFYSRKVDESTLDEVNQILKDNITGEVKQAEVKTKEGIIHVYVEFMNSEFKD